MHGIAKLIKLANPHPRKRLPRFVHPYTIERSYTADLKGMVALMRSECSSKLFPRLEHYLNANARQDSLYDDAYGALEDFKIQFFRQYSKEELLKLAMRQGRHLDTYNQGQMTRVIGINAFGAEPWLEDQLALFSLNNANLIKTIPERFFSDVSLLMFNGLRDGRPWGDLQDELMSRFEVSDWNAERLARDQISKLNAGLNQFRQEDLGIDGYFWRGTLDERERDSHRAHEGIRYAWNDPPADTGHPGDDVLCRCNAEPDLAKFYQ